MGRKINEREDPKRYILKENCEKILWTHSLSHSFPISPSLSPSLSLSLSCIYSLSPSLFHTHIFSLPSFSFSQQRLSHSDTPNRFLYGYFCRFLKRPTHSLSLSFTHTSHTHVRTFTHTLVGTSVTRWCPVSPIWQILGTFWGFIWCLAKLRTYFGNFQAVGQSFIVVNGQILIL